MADAVFWQILEAVQTKIRTITYSTQSGNSVPPIKDAAVVIRKLPFSKQDGKNDPSEETPGVIISPLKAVRPPMAGTNARDDATYHVLVQFINRDDDYRTNNLKTYLKWSEQICKYFQSAVLSDVQSSEGVVNFGYAVDYEVLDARGFLHKWFVSAIELQFIARETRGLTT